MKKVVLFIIFSIIIDGYLFSQIGIKGGVNLSSVNDDYYYSSYRVGFHMGGFYDVNLSKKFVFQPQILFSYEPFNREMIFNEVQLLKSHVNPYVLSFPLLMSYRYPVSKNSKIILDLGPFLSFRLFGKTKREVWENDIFIGSQKYNINNADRSYADIGLMGGIGLEANQYLFTLYLKHGLYKGTSDNKTISFMVSMGYRFGK